MNFEPPNFILLGLHARTTPFRNGVVPAINFYTHRIASQTATSASCSCLRLPPPPRTVHNPSGSLQKACPPAVVMDDVDHELHDLISSWQKRGSEASPSWAPPIRGMDRDLEIELCAYTAFIVVCLVVLWREYIRLSESLIFSEQERRVRVRDAIRHEVRFRQQLHDSLPPRPRCVPQGEQRSLEHVLQSVQGLQKLSMLGAPIGAGAAGVEDAALEDAAGARDARDRERASASHGREFAAVGEGPPARSRRHADRHFDRVANHEFRARLAQSKAQSSQGSKSEPNLRC